MPECQHAIRAAQVFPITADVITNAQKKNKLYVFHQNIRGLTSKLDEFSISLRLMLEEKNIPIDVICLTEHHLKESHFSHFNLDSYDIMTYYCRKTKEKGGACIYVKKILKCNQVKLDSYCKDQDIECCAVEVETKNNKLYIIVCVYRAPSGNFPIFLVQLEKILSAIFKHTAEIIICGDFNVDYLSNSPNKFQLDMLMKAFNLQSVIKFPTRIQGNSQTLIDNIFIDSSKNIQFSVNPIINGLSDHDAQILSLSAGKSVNLTSKPPKVKIRLYNNNTMENLKIMVGKEFSDFICVSGDINIEYNNFLNKFLFLFEHNIQTKTISLCNNSRDKGWINDEIITACKEKRILYNLSRNGTNNAKVQYKSFCKRLNKTINESKREYFKSIIASSYNKTKTLWNITNVLTGKSRPVISNIKLKKDDMIIDNPFIIANIFNDYFLSVVEGLIENTSTGDLAIHLLKNSLNTSYNKIVYDLTTSKEIVNVISSLNQKNSCGYDGINTKVLKACAHVISRPISLLCNLALSTGVFPERLKHAVIKPLYKKGSKEMTCNYRPISLLTSFSKIFEKVIYNRLIIHINKYDILSASQFGFRHGTSTNEAMFKLISEITNAWNKKFLVMGIFCDMSKAFDCVNHEILLNKLLFYGITGKMNNLLRSYLLDRTQSVELNNGNNANKVTSSSGVIKHGVPQGSILGPLLFLIYINDLSYFLPKNVTSIFFADDTSILITNKTNEALTNLINLVTSKLSIWFKSNNLILNTEKTNFMEFLTKNKPSGNFKVVFENKELVNLNFTKFLGIQLDKSLYWNKQNEVMGLRLSSVCFALRCLHKVMDTRTMRQIYYAMFHSLLSYGIIYWGNSSTAGEVFKIQKRAIRIISNSGKYDSCKPLFIKFEILTLTSQFIYSSMCFLVKNKHLFPRNNMIHEYHTRHTNDLHKPQNNLTSFQKDVTYTSINIFNHLPIKFKQLFLSNDNDFKTKLKCFLKLNPYYTLCEFYNY